AVASVYTLSLHDALPICFVPDRHLIARAGCEARVALASGDQALLDSGDRLFAALRGRARDAAGLLDFAFGPLFVDPRAVFQLSRSEEHTSELQSLAYLVC